MAINNVDALEKSPESSKPVELFVFSYGVDSYAYCTGGRNLVIRGRYYKAISINREAITRTDNLLKSNLKLELQKDCEVGALAFDGLEDRVLSVRAYRADPTVPDERYLYYTGSVATFELNELSVTFEVYPPTTALNRDGLTPKYMRMCRHRLYSKGCGVDKRLHRDRVKIIAISQGVVVIESENGDNALGDQRYRFGEFSFNGTHRQILVCKELDENDGTISFMGTDHTFTGINYSLFDVSAGNTTVRLKTAYALGLRKPIDGLSVGDEVWVSWGCDQTRVTCHELYGNVDNYGGFDFIPEKNPYSGVRVFS